MTVTTRRIPRVAAALVFGGCSGAESNVDEAERAALMSAVTNLCATLETCDPYTFSYSYADQNECIDEIYSTKLAEIEDSTAGYGEACGDAGLTYFECVEAALAADCYAYTYEACYAENLAIADACGA